MSQSTTEQRYSEEAIQAAQNSSIIIKKPRKKTGPSPKYGEDQAKKMVSMRLSPDALKTIKEAAEKVFNDSQADVVERMTRFFPPEALRKINQLAQEFQTAPDIIIIEALSLYEQNKKKAS